MLNNHIDHYPINTVYEFAAAAEQGKINEMDGIMNRFFNSLMVQYLDHQTKVLEYEYAFWFGLERAAGANQHEAISYIFEHPNLKMFKENVSDFQNSVKQINEEIQSKIYNPSPPDKIVSDTTKRVLRIASENGHFESFDLLKQLSVSEIRNLGEIYMGFFKKLNPNTLEKFLTIPNLREITKQNLAVAVSQSFSEENKYSFIVMRDVLEIDVKDIVTLLQIYLSQNHNINHREFCEAMILELGLNTKGSKRKVSKV